jgi:hypothetical protein
MILIIPTASEVPLYTQRTTLDGVEYVLRFDWNARTETWFLQLFDANYTALTGMIRVVIGLDLLRLHLTTEGVPPGQLIAADPGALFGDGQERPAYDDFGSRVRLLYIDASESEDAAQSVTWDGSLGGFFDPI